MSESGSSASVPVVLLPSAKPRAFELVLSYMYTDCIVPVKQGHFVLCIRCTFLVSRDVCVYACCDDVGQLTAASSAVCRRRRCTHTSV